VLIVQNTLRRLQLRRSPSDVSLWAPLKAARGIGQGARSTLTEKLARSFKLIFALILITLAITILAFSITATVIDPRIERHLAAGDAIERSHAGMLDQETGKGLPVDGRAQLSRSLPRWACADRPTEP
jgi:hypothetical protein